MPSKNIKPYLNNCNTLLLVSSVHQWLSLGGWLSLGTPSRYFLATKWWSFCLVYLPQQIETKKKALVFFNWASKNRPPLLQAQNSHVFSRWLKLQLNILKQKKIWPYIYILQKTRVFLVSAFFLKLYKLKLECFIFLQFQPFWAINCWHRTSWTSSHNSRKCFTHGYRRL